MNVWKRLIGDWWIVLPSIWPYPEGWGTYNKFRNTIMDTGLPSKEIAQQICDELNKGQP